MNMNNLVSIVLPVYNGEKYLSQAIESVLNQSYKNIELIIVNDCSTDSTEEIAIKYKNIDDRIIYIKNKKNLKLPKSLNIGFEVANGTYFSWTSDDNIYHFNAIKKMVQFLDNNADVGLVCCDMYMINENGDYLSTFKVGPANKLIIRNNIGACFLYRSTIAKQIGGYRTDLFLVEDYDYWLRLYFHSSISYIHDVLYDYRFHSDSLTESKKSEINRVLTEYQLENLKKYEKFDISKNELFDFFTHLIQLRHDWLFVLLMIPKFSIKHPTYIYYLIKKLINLYKR